MKRYSAIDGCFPLDLMSENPNGAWTDEASAAAARIVLLDAFADFVIAAASGISDVAFVSPADAHRLAKDLIEQARAVKP